MSTPRNKLKVFEPLEQLRADGFICKRWQGRIYPPFIEPAFIQQLQSTWDTSANDIFICTPQKVGTHLTKQFVVEILRQGYSYPFNHPITKGDIGHGTVPWPEVMVSQHGFQHFYEFLNTMSGHPRLWYSHCSENDLPFRQLHSETRFLFTMRDPKAAAVSQYFFYKAHPNLGVPATLEMDEFLDLFLNGPLYFGNYHEQINGWISGCGGRIKQENILLLRYEDLVEKKETSARLIAQFLFPGKIWADEQIKNIAASTDFLTMKKKLTENPQSFHFNTATFFRAGTTNDWQNHLTDEQAKRIDEKSESIWGTGCTTGPILLNPQSLHS